ncbi:conserved hypothetical protein [Desulfamplus magnetovallimortis]|uniref:Carbamoyltransferase n=1 Tax=Desulfamplus magnetovallimortis TaxID=1246637 RepID=A0A1W1HBW3_9BACT|nr:carbamoyltransferase [Desulfamplus magnetovallimortis]SLM29991.1 conserved hypothetical protein [Desulfamplus magnetovallimortis]
MLPVNSINQTKILGISAYYHDSAAALIVDGKIVAAAQEERFTRKKHDASFPVNATSFVLEKAGISVSELDAVAFYDKPYIKFERLLESFHSFAPSGLGAFLKAIPVWIKEKLFMRSNIWSALEKIDGASFASKPHLFFPEHHLSHASSAFYPSPFQESAILTIDGVGEWATTTICHGKGDSITKLRELSFPHSLGLLYSSFTGFCGFKVNSGEYKLMGLAPYGISECKETQYFKEAILNHMIDIRPDGSIFMNMDYFKYAAGLKMYNAAKWQILLGIPERPPETKISQSYMNLALALQEITEEIVLKMAKTAKDITESSNLVMAGGVALNCVANGKLLKSRIFDSIWIQPAAGDAGGAIGAALAAHHIYYSDTTNINESSSTAKNPEKNRLYSGCSLDVLNRHGRGPATPDHENNVSISTENTNSSCDNSEKHTIHKADDMQGAYLGPSYTTRDAEKLKYRYQAKYEVFPDTKTLCRTTAKLISENFVVGWFQGKMEWGPRALGNRSIVADPRDPETQKKLNLKIKYREGFRPFAPSVMAEHAKEYFDIDAPSPYMLMVAPVKYSIRTPEPEGYSGYELYKRLYHVRSTIPAVTHVDYSARIQTVHKETNPRYWQLISEFKKITGIGLLVNTSFNVRGEPIVCTPEDAYRCFMRTEMDVLVIENLIFFKKDQPKFRDVENWQEKFELD